MHTIPELFGSLVFNDETMKERLPKDTYKAMKKTIEEGKSLDLSVANVVANAMKDWAISKGVTHFTHWFQPMTGVTAEKHDSFISATPGRQRHHGIFRQRAHQGRTGRLQLPLRRPAGHL